MDETQDEHSALGVLFYSVEDSVHMMYNRDEGQDLIVLLRTIHLHSNVLCCWFARAFFMCVLL